MFSLIRHVESQDHIIKVLTLPIMVNVLINLIILRNNVWEAVRGVWMLIENIDNVPGLGEDEKASMVAQAKCILASRYFDVFSSLWWHSFN